MPTPNLLSIESATRTLTLAISRGAELRVARASTPGHHHAETILSLIDEALAEAQLTLADIGAFAVSIGPGSFTSLRIGLSTVKGLAFDSPRVVAPVSSLHAIAQAAAIADASAGDAAGANSVPTSYLALLDASRGEAYAAAFAPSPSAAGGALEEILPEGVYAPEELAAAIAGPCALVGDAAESIIRMVEPLCAHELRMGPADLCAARGVAILGARSLAAGGGVAARDLAPRYVRRAEAEVQRTQLRFEDEAPGGEDARASDGPQKRP